MALVAHSSEKPPTAKPRIVCEIDASTRAEDLVGDAIAACVEQGAELHVVWVLEPMLFGSPFPGSPGAVGTFGLPVVLHTAVERARERGIPVSSAIRVGEREVVLRRETEATGTVAVFRLDDGATQGRQAEETIVRCPDCGWRFDPRAVHFCPRVHLRSA